ncbi:hypothetical protein EV191_1011225 [Tamaricihabitans halophyticus]|uniref:Uncharacterized protein n=1 Tax=Tamaricihabitans halophyticus TaxID=1262583 RepID=A0A4R2R388_9PSEU|nr:hypothetical protein [Tamaricihabitans halophyticus]TCP57272.1 hypothetical protein EV191_1011225 [Tamaricihabitans halophyticus]
MTSTEPVAKPVRRPRVSLWSLRVVVVANSVAVLAQPVLAGGYLSGNFNYLRVHESVAHAVISVMFVQGIIAIAYWFPGGGSVFPLLASIVQWFSIAMQLGMGYSRQLAVHIPLGVFIALLSCFLVWWVCRPAAARGRREARR